MASPPSHVQALLPDPSCLKLNSVDHQAGGRVLIAAAAFSSVAYCRATDLNGGSYLQSPQNGIRSCGRHNHTPARSRVSGANTSGFESDPGHCPRTPETYTISLNDSDPAPLPVRRIALAPRPPACRSEEHTSE